MIAPLADLIETDSDSAASVEAALGATLQALVVENVGDLPAAPEFESLSGRVAFVPISRLGSTPRRYVLDTIGMFGDRVVPLRALVRAQDGVTARPGSSTDLINPERIEAMLDRLLGDTFLVPDVEAAMLLAGGPLAGRRMVTRDGCVVEADGRIVAGPVGTAESGGVLQQRGELAGAGRGTRGGERGARDGAAGARVGRLAGGGTERTHHDAAAAARRRGSGRWRARPHGWTGSGRRASGWSGTGSRWPTRRRSWQTGWRRSRPIGSSSASGPRSSSGSLPTRKHALSNRSASSNARRPNATRWPSG
ncbi:MAG: hypothetical protein HND58_17585 [Planctomycetota bacterium]|nr:MAG: hypothetical protein HND58_17585 [Planctomycetota bacterium]